MLTSSEGLSGCVGTCVLSRGAVSRCLASKPKKKTKHSIQVHESRMVKKKRTKKAGLTPRAARAPAGVFERHSRGDSRTRLPLATRLSGIHLPVDLRHNRRSRAGATPPDSRTTCELNSNGAGSWREPSHAYTRKKRSQQLSHDTPPYSNPNGIRPTVRRAACIYHGVTRGL